MFVIGQRLEMQYYNPTTNQWCVYKWSNYIDSALTSDHGGVVLGSGKVLYLLRYLREKTSAELSAWHMHRTGKIQVGCAKWTLRDEGRSITEALLDDFPLGEQIQLSGYCALLSFKPERAAQREAEQAAQQAAAQAKVYPYNQPIIFARAFP